MREEIIFQMKSPNRDDFKIRAFIFGEGQKSLAIVGSLRGDEVQQQFIASQLVKNLIQLEENDGLIHGHQIMVIPSANHFSMNINKRFWAMDNTDINRMFPGYEKGETTQRIAYAIFESVKSFTYGIQLTSYYIPGQFIPHVRIMNTGYQNTDIAQKFGLPYIFLRDPKPYDTTVLNYNWQVFGTQAFSVFSGDTSNINKESAKITWTAILRFMHKCNIVKFPVHDGFVSQIIDESDTVTVKSNEAGILYALVCAGDQVKRGDLLAKILDPFTGETRSTIFSTVKGTVFFAHQKPLIHQNSVLFKIIVFE
jgi:predicted deacylase